VALAGDGADRAGAERARGFADLSGVAAPLTSGVPSPVASPVTSPVASPVASSEPWNTREALAAGVILGLSAVAQAGWFDWVWADARVIVALLAGVLVPGYAIVRLWLRRVAADWLEYLPLAFAAGFALQLPWCIVMMNVGGSTRLAARLGLLLAAGLLLLAWRRRVLGAVVKGVASDVRSVRAGGEGAWRLALVAVLAVLGYLLSPYVPYAENEELLIARKLFENDTLTYRNVMHRPDEPTTYLYPVYMFLQAFLSHLVHLDVIVVHVKLRWVLAVLAIAIQYGLARLFTGRPSIAAAFAVILAGLVIWDPNTWSYGLGLLAPFNNRFGVAPSILLPAALYLLARVYRGPAEPSVVVLFATFLFATAVVHTREALQVLLVGGALLAVSLALRARDRSVHVALGAGLLGLVLAFAVFQAHHKSRVPYMVTLVGQMKDEVRQVRQTLKPFSAQAWTGLVSKKFATSAGDYQLGQFQEVFALVRTHTGGFYFMLVLPLLPLLPLARRHWQAVYLWALLVPPLFFVRAPLLYTVGAEVVGTTDLELMAPVLVQGGFLLAVTAAAGLVAALLTASERGTAEASATARRTARWTVLAGGAAAAFWLARDVTTLLQARAQANQARLVGIVLAASILTCIAAAAAAWRRAAFGIHISGRPLEAVPSLAALAALVILAPWPRGHDPDLVHLARSSSNLRGIVSLDRDYAKIASVPNIDTRLPPEVVSFIRDVIGPHHVFATTPRELNRILLYTNSYISNAPSQIATALDVEYFDLLRSAGSDPIFSKSPLLEREALVHWYLLRYGVEFLLVPPEFHDRLERELPTLNARRRLVERVYDQQRWAIWRVDRQALSPTPLSGH
jgi:hypothetical protein